MIFYLLRKKHKSLNLYSWFLQVNITEVNDNGNYLSAGDKPLPSLYFSMSLIYFITGSLWVYFLFKSRYVCINFLKFIALCNKIN